MRRNDLTIARLLRKHLETIPGYKRMVIFGSRARGDANQESDLDVFIEVSDATPEIRKAIQLAAWEISLENGVMISTLIASSYAIHHGMLAANPLMKSIETDGILV